MTTAGKIIKIWLAFLDEYEFVFHIALKLAEQSKRTAHVARWFVFVDGSQMSIGANGMIELK